MGGVLSEESHSFYVDATSAEEAAEKARSALAGLPVYVDEERIRLLGEEDSEEG